MKISNSKKQLAKIIHENGGWCDGTAWAAQDKRHCGQSNVISFYEDARPWFNGGDFWRGNGVHDDRMISETLVPNWHQTILSREEYFHLYPAPDADGWTEWKGGKCPVDHGTLVDVRFRDGMEMAGAPAGLTPDHFPRHLISWGWCDAPSAIIAYRLHKPEQAKPESVPVAEAPQTIEQLAADYRNRKDYADRKQQEADAAKADAESKLAELVAAGKALGLVLSVADAPEPELVITDWRDLRVGDEVEANYRGIERVVGSVLKIDIGDKNQPVFVSDGKKSVWATEWKFIRRPAKGGDNA